MKIDSKKQEEIESMREVNRLTAQTFTFIDTLVTVGMTTLELNDKIHDYIVNELKSRPAPLNYRGFPKSICTSLNNVVCHGIPDSTRLIEGDILNIDISLEKNGFYGDSSKMYCLGKVAPHAQRLVDLTQESLYRGIQEVRPGVPLNNIGKAIQKFAHQNKLSIVEEYCGHGIGREFHQWPQVLHYASKDTGPILEPGMIFTIEPMLNLGSKYVKLLGDKWTVVTKDRSLSAQWEHTVLVTENGYEVLTIRKEENFS